MQSPRKHALARLAALSLGVLAAVPALAEGGTVTGKVTVQPARFQDETVVYLKGVPATGTPITHEMDQKGMKFRPVVLAIATGDSVRFLNHDGEEHNVYSPDGEAFNLGTFKVGETRTHAFAEPGVFRIQCSIHPEMLGYVFVAPNRHAAVIDRQGRYTITGVPPGTWRLAVWNPRLQGPEKTVTVTVGKTVEEEITIRR
jgi:plastocyanin